MIALLGLSPNRGGGAVGRGVGVGDVRGGVGGWGVGGQLGGGGGGFISVGAERVETAGCAVLAGLLGLVKYD